MDNRFVKARMIEDKDGSEYSIWFDLQEGKYVRCTPNGNPHTDEYQEYRHDTDLIPLNKRVVIRINPEPKKTKEGIILPDGTKESEEREYGGVYGMVAAVADDVDQVHVGDMVVVHRHCGVPIERNKEVLIVMNFTDIFAVVDA